MTSTVLPNVLCHFPNVLNYILPLAISFIWLSVTWSYGTQQLDVKIQKAWGKPCFSMMRGCDLTRITGSRRGWRDRLSTRIAIPSILDPKLSLKGRLSVTGARGRDHCGSGLVDDDHRQPHPGLAASLQRGKPEFNFINQWLKIRFWDCAVWFSMQNAMRVNWISLSE